MGTPSTARRDAFRNFCPRSEPSLYPRGSGAYYKECYDAEWKRLQKEYEEQQQVEANRRPSLEERVEVLEEQVRTLKELLQP